MKANELKNAFESAFDLVALIDSHSYARAAQKKHKDIPEIPYETMVVLGLAYPKRMIKHTKTHLVPSFYTFGKDYHQVLGERIEKVMHDLPFAYTYGVDNHPHDERLAATLSGLGYFAKNQLIISKTYGSYFFLAIVFIDFKLDRQIVLEANEDCGSCTKCIEACPTHALSEEGYDINRCISAFNQSKKPLTEFEMNKNYILFGCDICQMVCPKNINKGTKVHPEFELNGKEMVSITDLFSDSDREFKHKYQDMSYLWKGKTILMRNALLLLKKQKNTAYNDLIEQSLTKTSAPWYLDNAVQILEILKKEKKMS